MISSRFHMSFSRVVLWPIDFGSWRDGLQGPFEHPVAHSLEMRSDDAEPLDEERRGTPFRVGRRW